MRYYIYLDKCFIRNIFSVLEEGNFDIEVVEFSVRKSTTVNNQLSVSPYDENFCENGHENSVDIGKDIQKRNKDSQFKKDGIRGEIGCANSSTIETQRRYINIEDITEMKNNYFYHNLIKKLDLNTIDYDKITIETGFVDLIDTKEFISNDENQDFFKINDKYIWYNKNLLEGDINLLMQMSCKIKVIGYVMSCNENKKTVVKAIAMFIY